MTILIVRSIQEAIDEYKKYTRDQVLNLEWYQVFNHSTQQFEPKLSKDIREGEIIKIIDQRVPADIVIFDSKYLFARPRAGIYGYSAL